MGYRSNLIGIRHSAPTSAGHHALELKCHCQAPQNRLVDAYFLSNHQREDIIKKTAIPQITRYKSRQFSYLRMALGLIVHSSKV